ALPGVGRFAWTTLLASLGAFAGLLLLVLPALYLMLIWSMFPVICVHERLRGSRALGRSFALTDGHESRVIGLGLLSFVLLLLYELASVILVGSLPIVGT